MKLLQLLYVHPSFKLKVFRNRTKLAAPSLPASLLVNPTIRGRALKAHNQKTPISVTFYKLHEPQKIIGLWGTISALKQPNHQSLAFYV